MTTAVQQLRFDYRQLDAETRDFVQERAVKIHRLARATAAGIVEIGQHLTDVKAKLKHGKFLEWVEREFAWKERMAENFMTVHARFKSANFANLQIDVSALYLIAAPKTPEPVRQEVIRHAEISTDNITHSAVKDVIVEYNKTGDAPAAVAKSLGWKKIPCVVVKLKSIVAGEWAENEMRKQFTTTERTAIGKAVEEVLKDRRGKREVPENFPDLSKGQETRDFAAKQAGFKNPRTYEQAKKVVDFGTPELVEAMDKGDIKIDAAAKIASQPKADQVRIVQMPKDEQREVVRQIRKTKADKEADERRARDIRLFMGLYHAVKLIGDFREEPKATWEGLWRVSAYDFADHLNRALEYLPRLKKEHPNETKRPSKVS
jgi:hypothetical protein